ncbi:hypothetical protein BFP70_10855 [Thioclava sp. SK-1]|uniref:hypothetical protein n=1 Tax=Thioclava sp. SK-1 TaxID=1889770 RepID=UPI000825A09B|nr:hypothetical protein [Thioclava sp. SK-1]OCX64530.1 hypothetical protein BFP70_10855 [Thioclava sp. SK-1]
MRYFVWGAGVLILAGCTSPFGKPAQDTAPVAAPAPVQAPTKGMPSAAAASADSYDTTSAAERAEAVKKPAAAQARLGTTIASLGDPTMPGFWLKTGLVTAPAKGRVELANGKSAQVELIPSGDASTAGSQLSLPALRLLDVSLTDLPELTVYGS